MRFYENLQSVLFWNVGEKKKLSTPIFSAYTLVPFQQTTKMFITLNFFNSYPDLKWYTLFLTLSLSLCYFMLFTLIYVQSWFWCILLESKINHPTLHDRCFSFPPLYFIFFLFRFIYLRYFPPVGKLLVSVHLDVIVFQKCDVIS